MLAMVQGEGVGAVALRAVERQAAVAAAAR